ncbi:MAG: hypothetical protein ACW9WZ_01805 [Nitrosopumilus sp.]|jgi:hypothetical protein
MSHNDEINEEFEESLDQRFMNLYPDYDYSNKNKSVEKDVRKRKKMGTMY